MSFRDKNLQLSLAIQNPIPACSNSDCKARQSISGYIAAFEHAPTGVCLFTPTGDILHANKMYCKILGRTLSEIVGRNFEEHIHPEDMEADAQYIKKCEEGSNEPYERVKRYIRKDGEIIWIKMYATPTRHQDGSMEYFVAHVVDISEIRQAQNDLKNVKDRLALALAGSMLGFWEWNIVTGQVFLSPQTMSMLGHPEEPATISFAEWTTWWHPEDRSKVFKTIHDNLDTLGQPDIEFRIKNKEGLYHWFKTKAQATWDENNEPTRMLGFLTDFHDARERQRNLTNALEEARKANEELQQFAYIASHDLQEPLRTVNSYLQLFVMKYKDKVDDKGQQYVSFILEANTRMRNLIRDLLDYSRSGKEAPKEVTSFHAIMRDVMDLLSVKIKQTRARITYDCWNDVEVYGTHTELVRLFQNLISNSIKFKSPTKRPMIKIGYKLDDGIITFSVSDNGVGIAPENYEKLFKMFYRIRSQAVPDADGNGIGLAICKKLVEKHGGTIRVESVEGKGSKFLFTMPANLEKSTNEGSDS